MKVQALIDQVLDEAMRLGQKPHGAYKSYWDVYNPIITFFRGRGLEDYSPEVLKEYIAWVTDKYQNGQIKRERHSMLTTAARRVAHFERTGAYLWNVPKRGTRYELDAYYTGLMDEFLASDDFHPNTAGDLEWVARRYFHWLRGQGITDIRQAEQETIQKYLHSCMEEMKPTSVYNVHLYLKKLYRFLSDRGYCVERSAFGQGNDYWFPSASGGPISSEFQTKIFKKAWAAANPDVPKAELPAVRVYDLRHRFASAALIRWLDKGDSLKVKLPYLREYMGHNSLRETCVYIHILPENLTRSSAIDWTGFYDLLPEVRNG